MPAEPAVPEDVVPEEPANEEGDVKTEENGDLDVEMTD